MKKWTKTAGLLFMAASSVYYGQAVVAAPGKSGSAATGGKAGATDVRLLEELAPAAAAAPGRAAETPAEKTTEPSTDAPTGTPAAVVDAKAATEGRSVSKSEVQVSDEGTVEIHVNDASLVEVLRMLSLQSQKNIICSKEVRGTVTANLYNVTIREALNQILAMNGFAYREKGNFINVYTIKELQALEQEERRTTTEVFRLHYTPAANAMTMIKPVLSTVGQVSATTPALAGIAAGSAETGGNNHAVEDMLVVTDYPDVLERVRKVLKDIDRKPQQVLVEATILRAALTEDNAMGVDFNVLAGVKFNSLTNVNGQINGATAGSPQAVGNAAGSIGTGNNFSSTVPNGFKIGFVSDNVSVFLSALEGVSDTVVLANPKVLALNKQKGEVIVGRKDGYLTTTVTDSSTVQTVEFLDTGTRLIFRPFIGDDGFVRMELHPEDSSGGLTGANLPFKVTTEMTSNIMVKDGHTIVIGGLFRESSETSRSQTPFLGNLPLAGPLFRQQRDRTTREEIIILLTPHIIKDDAVADKAATEMMDKAEKLRVGVRKGMMPWGRERLAEGAYESALNELKKPNPNNQKALWHLDCATNLNPKFVEAIELKQKLTGRQIYTSDASAIRGYVKDMVLKDRAPATQPVGGTDSRKVDLQATTRESATDPFADIDWENLPAGAGEADDAVAAKPATTQPSAQTTVADAKPASTQPVVADAKPVEASKPAAAATEETASGSDKKSASTPGAGFVVTELPVEEIKADVPLADDNK